MRVLTLVATWLLQVLLGVVFVLIGTGKFMDSDWPLKFARWGYPDGFYMIVGAVEAIAGIALLIPRFASYAGLVIIAIMAGAAATHAVHGEGRRLIAPLLFMALAALVAWLRRRSARRIAPEGLRRSPEAVV